MSTFTFASVPFRVKLLTLAILAGTLGLAVSDTQASADDDELLMFVNMADPKAAIKAPAQPRPQVQPPRSAPVQTRVQPLVQQPPVQTRVQPLVQQPPVQTRVQPVTPPPMQTRPAERMLQFSAQPGGTPAAPAPVAAAQPTVSTQPAIPAPRETRVEPARTPVTVPGENEWLRPQTSSTRTMPVAEAPVSARASSLATPYEPAPQVAAAPRRAVAGAPSEGELKALFAKAVARAISFSPRINSSRSQADAAVESIAEAKGQRWPQVDLTSNSKNMYFGSGTRNGGSSSDLPSVNINVATALYDFGKTSNTIKTREDQARAAAVGVEAEAENTAWELSNALIELSKQRLIIQVSQDYVTRMQGLTNMIGGIVAVDTGRRSELTQAKGRLLSAQSSLDAATSRARDTEIVIHRLLGDTQIALPPATQWNLGLPNLSKQLNSIENHPVVAKAKADSQAALSEAAAVKSSSMPSLNWVVSKNTGEDELGRKQAFQTGLQMSWGLFRGGSSNAAERAAIARAEASRHLVDEQMRDLEQRVRAANQDAGSLLQRGDLYQNLTRESDRIRLAFFEQWYHLGKRTLLDVLSAESDYYNNRVSEVTSRFDGYSAIMRSYASSGMLIKWLNNRAE